MLLCEKSDKVGGTGSTSAGTLWIPGNSQSRAAGFSDSGEQADLYLNSLIGEVTNRELRNAHLQTGPTAIDYLCARTDVQFLPCGIHPDYGSNMSGAAVAGRAIMSEPFDGRPLGLPNADIAVSTGLATDADARVIGNDGKPIPGLYACGNDMASVMAGSYPGPGTTLGPAIVFAYRAAMHAKSQL